MKLAWDSKRQTEREGAKASGKYFRERSDDLYHSTRWTRLSKTWRAIYPLIGGRREAHGGLRLLGRAWSETTQPQSGVRGTLGAEPLKNSYLNKQDPLGSAPMARNTP